MGRHPHTNRHSPLTTHHSSLITLLLALAGPLVAAEPWQQPADTSRGDAMIAEYFRAETARLTSRCLANIETLEDWTSRRDRYRKQLFEMLGLSPQPEKTPLHPVITGKAVHDDFTVENLHFQSRPGLYVTGNLYVPRGLEGKAPTILYVCGHARAKKDGISYGNKTAYQHHGGWFARNGYVCLTIDTLQLGEIEGIHHGTYNHDMWWWNARGYSSAGVEAWNCIRALDYLQTRPEVDADRIGVTGRSGGGAYSWWISALDERIKVAVPVAGITSLHNHVVDGTVEGHCDCMYHANTYRWDYPLIAALVAPRPLLISNSDKDRIFPLDGVVDVYTKTRRIYELYGRLENIGLQITEGPHKDTQELRIHAFHWFNRFLKEDPAYAGRNQPLIEMAAVKFFEPEQLKVFDELPADEKNSTIQETFTRKAPPAEPPASGSDWDRQKTRWMRALKNKCFRGWPDHTTNRDREAETGQTDGPVIRSTPGGGAIIQPGTRIVRVDEHGVPEFQRVPKLIHLVGGNGTRLTIYRFNSQQHIPLRLYVVEPKGTERTKLSELVLHVTDQAEWERFHSALHAAFPIKLPEEQPQGEPPSDADEWFRSLVQDGEKGRAVAWFAPRGIGPTVWDHNPRKRVQIRRRFMQLGQTLDGMRVWDVRRAVQALRSVEGFSEVPLWMQGEREAAGITLYASLFEPDIQRLDLRHLNPSHRDGPIFLNVLRFLDIPQAVAMAADRSQVRLYQEGPGVGAGWEYPQAVAKTLGWNEKQLQIRNLAEHGERGP